ncbi:MAG: galactose-1-phosphate uridylyltransferase [Granulosicoccus sp.]
MAGNWERRWHPLLSQWVMVSAQSAARPWSGAMATGNDIPESSHDPECYLCPRVVRANGVQNPDFQGAYAFENDFATLSFEAPEQDSDKQTDLLELTAPAHGRCRVLCWSERHDATLASLSADEMQQVAMLWRSEYAKLSAQDGIANVLIFENKGKETGVSNLHPHGQIYATAFVTDTATRMRNAQSVYASRHDGKSLMQDLLSRSHTQEHLLVDTGRHFSVMVPFAARFAFETWIVPHRHVSSLAQMSDEEISDLAQLYQRQARRYDVLFKRSAPNITLIHNSPCDTNGVDADKNANWCFHLAFQPPLRDPEKMKFLAGFESGSNNIVNPVQPEVAAEQLRQIDVGRWHS